MILFGVDGDVQYDEDATGAGVTVDLAGSKLTLPAVISGTPSQSKPFSTEQSWQGPKHVLLPRQPRLFY